VAVGSGEVLQVRGCWCAVVQAKVAEVCVSGSICGGDCGNGAGAMVRSVNGEDGCCGGRHGCARGRRTRWWLARLQVQWRREDGGAAEKAPLVRGGGAELRNLLQWCGVPPRGGRKRGEDGDALVARALQRCSGDGTATMRMRCGSSVVERGGRKKTNSRFDGGRWWRNSGGTAAAAWWC